MSESPTFSLIASEFVPEAVNVVVCRLVCGCTVIVIVSPSLYAESYGFSRDCQCVWFKNHRIPE